MASDAPTSPGSSGAIPFRLLVGVTGHRTVTDDPALVAQVDRALERTRTLAPPTVATPIRLGVVSPLAEGADRLVVRRALQDADVTLEAPLPLPREEYVGDFETAGSRREFESLLDRADRIVAMPFAASRREAYEQVGRYVVDRSDVLIALWDGEPARGRGGTAEMVTYARERGRPLLWIKTASPFDLTEELGAGLAGGPFSSLDRYNSASLDPAEFAEACERRTAELTAAAEAAGLGRQLIAPFLAWTTAFYERASLLAARHQQRYFNLTNALFLVVAAAVALSAGLALFAPDRAVFAWVEVAVALTLLGLLVYDRVWKPHDRWISARFLAERFRSAFFVAVAGAGGGRIVSGDRIYVGPTSDEWATRAFEEVWDRRPSPDVVEAPLEALKRFLAVDWIEDQRRYHQRTSLRYRRRHSWLIRASALLFGTALVVALLKAFGLAEGGPGGLNLAKGFDLLGVALPALAGALSGIRAQREYLRNAERYARMVPYLEVLGRRMAAAPDLATARTVALEAEAAMLDEARDWFVIMRASGVGPT